MKFRILLLLAIFISLSAFSQDKKVIADVYFKKAKQSLEKQDVVKTEEYLTKSVKYSEGITNKEIAVFGGKFFYEQKKFEKAKEYLQGFFKLNKKKKSKLYDEMLLLYTYVLDGIDNPKDIKIKKKIEDDTAIRTDDLEERNTIDNSDDMETEPVSFIIIEDVPVFPGCYGSKTQLKDCFSKMVQMHFATNFNSDLPNTLGLKKGTKRVFISFLIDKLGKVTNIAVNAPHPELKKEVIKVMKMLPKMEPGTQRGKPVGVKYSIPFSLIVD